MHSEIASLEIALDVVDRTGYLPDGKQLFFRELQAPNDAFELITRDPAGQVDIRVLMYEGPQATQPEEPLTPTVETEATFGYFNGLFVRRTARITSASGTAPTSKY